MIKGVNRKIVEIKSNDSIYFEKAVFYLRPEVRELPAEISKAEAEKYISSIVPEYGSYRKKLHKRSALFLIIALILSAVLFFVLKSNIIL